MAFSFYELLSPLKFKDVACPDFSGAKTSDSKPESGFHLHCLKSKCGITIY